MALTSARQILNKKILGTGGVPSADEIPIDIEGLSATKLSDGLEEIVGDIDDVSTSVSTVSGKVEDLEEANNYSTTEHIVGKWIDDSDIYQKIITLNADVSVDKETWTNLFELADVERMIGIKVLSSSNGINQTFMYRPNQGYIQGYIYASTFTFGTGTIFIVDYIKPAPSPEPTESKKKTTKKK